MSKLSPAETALKKLRKIDSNMICPNCGTAAPVGIGFGNVCVKFKTFVCDLCKTSHQAISHRVKSITMSNWTMEEVRELSSAESGGNEACAHTWLANAPKFGGKYPGGTRPKEGDRVVFFKQFVIDCYEHGKFRASSPYIPSNNDLSAFADGAVKKQAAAAKPMESSALKLKTPASTSKGVPNSSTDNLSNQFSSSVNVTNLLDDDAFGDSNSSGFGAAFGQSPYSSAPASTSTSAKQQQFDSGAASPFDPFGSTNNAFSSGSNTPKSPFTTQQQSQSQQSRVVPPPAPISTSSSFDPFASNTPSPVPQYSQHDGNSGFGSSNDLFGSSVTAPAAGGNNSFDLFNSQSNSPLPVKASSSTSSFTFMNDTSNTSQSGSVSDFGTLLSNTPPPAPAAPVVDPFGTSDLLLQPVKANSSTPSPAFSNNNAGANVNNNFQFASPAALPLRGGGIGMGAMLNSNNSGVSGGMNNNTAFGNKATGNVNVMGGGIKPNMSGAGINPMGSMNVGIANNTVSGGYRPTGTMGGGPMSGGSSNNSSASNSYKAPVATSMGGGGASAISNLNNFNLGVLTPNSSAKTGQQKPAQAQTNSFDFLQQTMQHHLQNSSGNNTPVTNNNSNSNTNSGGNIGMGVNNSGYNNNSAVRGNPMGGGNNVMGGSPMGGGMGSFNGGGMGYGTPMQQQQQQQYRANPPTNPFNGNR